MSLFAYFLFRLDDLFAMKKWVERSRGETEFAGHQSRGARGTMPVRESLTAREAPKRLQLKRRGKIERTRRLASRYWNPDPPIGAPLTTRGSPAVVGAVPGETFLAARGPVQSLSARASICRARS
jgi:hypothetical protein